MTSEVVLSVRNLSTEYRTAGGAVQAVRDVSFDLRRLERLAIVGESGSGKSALALSIVRLIEPPGRVVGGEVLLGGRDLARLGEKAMRAVRGREVALIFQDPMTALDPIRTIGRQLAEAVRAHGDVGRRAARRRAAELLRDVEIPGADRRLDDYPHQFSGGMRQRVTIAIALANAPRVLIADEPTTALDVTTQAQILDLLERLSGEREISVIMISHNLGLVAEFCTTVQVMYAGRLVEQAPSLRLFAEPAHPYTRALLDSVVVPGLPPRRPLRSIPGMPPDLARLPAGCPFEPRCQVGHGRATCVERAPAAVPVTGPLGTALAECHFAGEASR